MRKLFIINGPDRVGKSTLAEDLGQALVLKGHNPVKQHFSEPPTNQKDITERYRVSINQFLDNPEVDTLIWDRSYLCAYILERFRKNSHSYIGELIQLEIWMAEKAELLVEHIGLTLPWCDVARAHLHELRRFGDHRSEWSISGAMLARCSEHQFYTDEMLNFYQNLTMFPSVVLSSREEVYSYLEFMTENG